MTRHHNDFTHEKLSKAGQKGGQASSGHKAMETRAHKLGKSVQEVAAEMGRKGGQSSSGYKSLETRAGILGKSVHDVAAEMGRKGGQHSHGGGRNKRSNEES